MQDSRALKFANLQPSASLAEHLDMVVRSGCDGLRDIERTDVSFTASVLKSWPGRK